MADNFYTDPANIPTQYQTKQTPAQTVIVQSIDVPEASEEEAGKVVLASQADVDVGNVEDSAVTPSGLGKSVWVKKKIAKTIGDGVSASLLVEHNHDTREVFVVMYRLNVNFDKIRDSEYQIQHPDTNTVRIIFNTVPATASVRVIILS